MTDRIFFAAYVDKRSSITVIDLQRDMSYERGDWDVVNDVDHYTSEESIAYTRDLAKRHNINYKPFDSRYGEETTDGYIY